MDESQPPPKVRRRRLACHCQLCNGEERDYRTVQSHAMNFPPHTPVSTNQDDEMMITDEVDLPNEVVTDGNSTANEVVTPTEDFVIKQQKSGYTKEVLKFILEELKVKLKYGTSYPEFEQHLLNTKRLIKEEIPVQWSDVLKLLTLLGYQSPKHYKVCLRQDHSHLLCSKGDCCPFCGNVWDEAIDYFVLGFMVNNWFTTEERCDTLMAHWQERESWVDGNDTSMKTELWHGNRFQQLSWFWDFNKETLLPGKCPSCQKLISAEEIEKEIARAPDSTTPTVSIICESCCTKFIITPNYMRGDPRNQAIIIHEDGWASHSTSSAHSVAAITISHACSSKLHRSSGSSCRVYSFIPVDRLPTKAPHKYDAFFIPLIQEVEQLFLYGEPVFFKSPVEGYSPGNDTFDLRVLPLLITADMKAHAEIGLTCAGGKKGCRRCEVVGVFFLVT